MRELLQELESHDSKETSKNAGFRSVFE
jgi:hypothetical protein